MSNNYNELEDQIGMLGESDEISIDKPKKL